MKISRNIKSKYNVDCIDIDLIKNKMYIMEPIKKVINFTNKIYNISNIYEKERRDKDNSIINSDFTKMFIGFIDIKIDNDNVRLHGGGQMMDTEIDIALTQISTFHGFTFRCINNIPTVATIEITPVYMLNDHYNLLIRQSILRYKGIIYMSGMTGPKSTSKLEKVNLFYDYTGIPNTGIYPCTKFEVLVENFEQFMGEIKNWIFKKNGKYLVTRGICIKNRYVEKFKELCRSKGIIHTEKKMDIFYETECDRIRKKDKAIENSDKRLKLYYELIG